LRNGHKPETKIFEIKKPNRESDDNRYLVKLVVTNKETGVTSEPDYVVLDFSNNAIERRYAHWFVGFVCCFFCA